MAITRSRPRACTTIRIQWGSKRNGPDLARVGGKYSNDWQRDHLRDPRAVVPSSIMPGYAFLSKTPAQRRPSRRADAPAAGRRRALHATSRSTMRRPILPAQAALRRRRARAELQKRYPNAVLGDVAGEVCRHRGRRADRLSAASRRLRGLQALRRQGQHQVSVMNATARRFHFRGWRDFAASWGFALSSP